MSAGSIFVELDIDASRFTAKERRIIDSARDMVKRIEDNWKLLGGKSDAMYNAMRLSAENAFKRISESAKASDAEKLRAHRLYAEKIKQIDDEQTGRAVKNIDNIRVGWLTMIKGAIVFRTAMAAIHGLYESTIGSIFRGVKAIDDLKLAQASLASAFATNDISLTFDKAYAIAGGMVEKIQEMDRAFVGTAAELTILVDAMATYGAGVDLSNKHAQDQFVVFGNIIKLMTRGQDFQRQAMQEVRALMEGANVQGALIVKKLTAMGVNVKVMIPLWREQGTIIENINKYLSGYIEGGAKIEATLQAQLTSLKTIAYSVLREGMAGAYEDIYNFVKKINDSLRDENGLTEEARITVELLKDSWDGVKTVVTGIAIVLGGIVKGIKEIYELARKTRELQAGEGYFIDPFGIYAGGGEQKKGVGDLSKALEMFYGADLSGELLKTKGAGGKLSDDLGKLKDQWEETKRSLEAKIESEGLDDLQKKIIQNRVEAEKLIEKFKSIPGAIETIRAWQTGADRTAAVEQAVKNVEAQEKQTKAYISNWEKAQIQYKKLVTDANDWSINDHQKAINKILSSEKTSLDKLEGWYQEGYITQREYEEGIAAVKKATAEATYIQKKKELADEIRFYQEIGGYGEAYHNSVMRWIEMEKKERASLFGEPAAEAWAQQYIKDSRDAEFAMTESFGEVTEAIKMMKEGLIDYWVTLSGSRAYIGAFKDMSLDAFKTMQGYAADYIDAIHNGFNSMGDAITDFAVTGKQQFSDFARSVIADMIRIATQQAVIAPLMQAFLPITSPVVSLLSGGGRASGGPVLPGMAYIVGEKGPELFTPSTAGNIIPNAGSIDVDVNVINQSGVPMTATKRPPRFDGQRYILDVVMDGMNRNVGGIRDLFGGR